MTQLDQAALAEIRVACSNAMATIRATAWDMAEVHQREIDRALSLLAALAPAATQGGADMWRCDDPIQTPPLDLEGFRAKVESALSTPYGGPIMPFPAPAPEAERGAAERIEDLEGVLRSLASWLGNGGYNAPEVDPAAFEAKIRDGVEHEIVHARREEREWCAAWIEGSPLVLEANRGFIGDCLRAGRTGSPAPATQDAGLAEAARNLLDPTDASAADLWSAINDYAVACGGSPGEHVYGNTRRQRAVAEVENAVRERLRAALDRARTGEAR